MTESMFITLYGVELLPVYLNPITGTETLESVARDLDFYRMSDDYDSYYDELDAREAERATSLLEFVTRYKPSFNL